MSTTITPLKALAEYFNEGAGKRPTRDFAAEVKALNEDEKMELAQGAATILGKTLITK